jgi:hypothetical protein
LLQKLDVKTQAVYGGTKGSSESVDRVPSELFQDAARIKASVHYALRDLVLTPQALAAELNSDKAK